MNVFATSLPTEKPTMHHLLQLAKQLQQGLMMHEMDEMTAPSIDTIAQLYKLEDLLRNCHRLSQTLETDWRFFAKAA